MRTATRVAWLVLEDGTAFRGRAVGADGEVFGEAVFNTAMTGYQEILTDPSYKGQIVCMTYPHIGNYGVNDEDVESRRPWVEGFILRELSPVASNFRSQESLDAYFTRHHVVAIDEVDTRALTLILRRRGTMKAGLSTTEPDPQRLLQRVRDSADIEGADLVKTVTCEAPYDWPPKQGQGAGDAGREKSSATVFAYPTPHAPRPIDIVVMDFGVKFNILRQLAARGCRVTVVPATTAAADILAQKPDGVVLSNGPGDPAAVTYAIATIQNLMGHVPMLGICLGHQLLGLAYGGETFKLKFGHHGGNHPVQDLETQKVEITTQNHNFAVRMESIPGRHVEVTHKNLNDGTVEGMRHQELPIVSLQYHPEAAPGPHDARYFFQRFLDLVEGVHA
ncbi:MAG: glutamine-hydrolyzing carbamoyl-phosphate synthase small subunit [Candidatus Omnitrophica bacterium]|nr:glutamine-hydrolyzing carbamoyl-phosphate synthase small subunit [Candidatus Omnitrophota bacterium]